MARSWRVPLRNNGSKRRATIQTRERVGTSALEDWRLPSNTQVIPYDQLLTRFTAGIDLPILWLSPATEEFLDAVVTPSTAGYKLRGLNASAMAAPTVHQRNR